MNLTVRIGEITFRNPLFVASGVLGSNQQLYLRAWKAGAGGIITKTYTYERRKGYDTPIIIPVECGYINAVGLENPGIGAIEYISRFLTQHKVKFIVSIAGRNVKEFLLLSEKAYSGGAEAVELNLSCPHAKKLGLELGMDPDAVREIIKKIKEEVDITVIPKFGFYPKVIQTAKIAEMAGADAISAINTIRSMKIDIWIKTPILSNKFGGLSGPSIHPIAVATIYALYQELEIPIIASGGLWSWKDAIEFFLAGASAVQIGSVIGEKSLLVIKNILEGIKTYLHEQGFNSLNQIVGLAHEE